MACYEYKGTKYTEEELVTLLTKESQGKTRRVLELQSDLFQKGRDKDNLISDKYDKRFEQEDSNKTEFELAKKEGRLLTSGGLSEVYYYKGYHYTFFNVKEGVYKKQKNSNQEDEKSNQFLQLLNKDNNWVTFFVKSIIQDSAKKGYEKVLFPSGNTASKVEGHTTLEEFKRQKEDRIKDLESEKSYIEKEEDGWFTVRSYKNGFQNTFKNEQTALTLQQINNYSWDNEINQLKEELERVNGPEGFGALKPIYNFYENTLTNILKKNFKVNQITDEYGNTWNELALTEEVKNNKIFLKKLEAPVKTQSNPNRVRLNEIFDGNSAELRNTEQVINKLLKKGYLPKNLIELANFLRFKKGTVRIVETLDNNEETKGAYMAYDEANREILIPLDRMESESKEDFARVFLHELMHHYTVSVIADPQNETEVKFAKRINELYQEILKNNPDLKSRSLSRVEEFIADIMSDKKFVDQIKGKTPTLWEKIVLAFKKLFRLNNTPSTTDQSVEEILNFIKYVNANPNYGVRQNVPSIFKKEIVDKSQLTIEVLMEKIENTIKTQKAIYHAKKNNTVFMNRLKELEATIENKDEIKTIYAMVGEASYWLNSLDKRMNEIKKVFNANRPLTEDEIQEGLTVLDEIKNFSSAYTILDDMDKLFKHDPKMQELIGNVRSVDADGNPTPNVIDLMIKRKRLMDDYLDQSLDFLTAWVYPYVENVNTNLEKEGRGDLVFTREMIRDRFLTAPKDIGYLNSLLGAAINSSDAINSLVALAIKKEMEKARMKDIDIKNELLSEYSKLSGPKNNPKAFNKDFLRLIRIKTGDDEKGNSIYSSNYGFIEEIDEDRFDEATDKFIKSLGDKPDGTDTVALNIYKKKVSEWYSKNIEAIDNLKEFLSEKRKELGDDYMSYILLNSRSVNKFYANENEVLEQDPKNPNNYLVISGELVRPKKSIYGNPKFEQLMKNPYYNLLYTTYKKQNNLLVKQQRLKYGMIPQVYKSNLDGLLDNGLDISAHLDRVQEFAKKMTAEKNEDGENVYIDTQYGRKGLQSLSGENVNYLPIYYNKRIDNINEISVDLLSSVLVFSQMANNFQAMYNILPHINTVSTVVLGSDVVPGSGRKIVKTSPGGQMVNAITGKTLKKDSNERANERLKAFIDAVFWGQENIPLEMKMFGKTVNLDKVFDKMGMVNAFSTMTLNLIGGINNSIVANYNTLNEATAGKYFNISDWLSAKKEYFSLIPTFISDLSKTHGKSKITQLIELYDAIQGEFRDEYGRGISGNAMKRGFTSSSFFFVNNATEHEAQITGFIAMLKSTKIKDNSGKEVSLYDAYEINNGKLKIKDNIQFSENDRFNLMNRLHGLNKELHGNYNSFDKSTLQRHALGRLALMFRKYIYTGYQRRWATGYVDFEQGGFRQGYYLTFLNKLAKDFKEKRYNTLFNWSKLTPQERSAFKQTIMDIGLLALVITMFNFLDDDDLKDNSALQNHTMLQLRRLQADIAFYGYFNSDVIRLMKTPAVTMDYMGRVIDWLDHVVLEWDEEDLYYQRKSGSHEKGDRKAYAKFEKIAMGLRGLAMFNTPEDQLTVFNNTTGAK